MHTHTHTHTHTVLTRPPYEVSETGWGEFEIVIKVFFMDSSEKPVSVLYDIFCEAELKSFLCLNWSHIHLCCIVSSIAIMKGTYHITSTLGPPRL